MASSHTNDNQTDDKINPIIIIGRFGAPFGVKGWIKVHSFTQPSDNIIQYQPWQVELKEQWSSIDIIEVRPHSSHFIANIKGVTSPEAAIAYRNADIGISREQLPALSSDEIYWSDLEDMTVIALDGTSIGRIDSIFATGANDVLAIKTDAKKEILIPFVRGQVIKAIDREKGTVTVDWDLE